MRVGIATDHGGFHLKEDMVGRLRAAGHEVTDFGAHVFTSTDDYPDFVEPLGRALVAGTVEDDHMNILCLGGRTIGAELAWDLIQAFLAAEYSQAARHLRRLGKVAALEAGRHAG